MRGNGMRRHCGQNKTRGLERTDDVVRAQVEQCARELFAHGTQDASGDRAEAVEYLEERDQRKDRCDEGDNICGGGIRC